MKGGGTGSSWTNCELSLLPSRIVLVAVCVLAVSVLAHSSGAAERELDESPSPSSTKGIKGPLAVKKCISVRSQARGLSNDWPID